MIWRGKHHKLIILTEGTGAFYLNALLRSLMFSLVRIFVPVFLFQTGVSLGGSALSGFLAVGGYYIILRLVVFLAAIPISKVIERIGFRRSVAISVFLLTAEMLCMAGATRQPGLIVVAALLSGINIPLYWVARDSALSQDIEGKGMGRAISVITSLEQISALAGPLAAGLIIVKWGFSVLFVIAVLILLLSAIPLWRMPHHTHKNGVSLRGFFQWIKNKRYSHQAVGIAGSCTQDYGLAVFWPLSIYLLGIELSTLGTIYSAVAVVAIGVKLIAGKIFDRLHARRDWADELVYAVASVGSALIWPVRIFLSSVGAIFLTDAIAEVFQGVYYNFHSDYAHLGGKRMGSIAFWVYVEMIYSLTVIGVMGVMLVGVYFGVWKELVFATISVWVLSSIVIARESNLK